MKDTGDDPEKDICFPIFCAKTDTETERRLVPNDNFPDLFHQHNFV